MVKSVAIVGAGINGLLTAFLICETYPGAHIDVYDADKHPANTTNHRSVTHGSRDARHITGSESIGFESSIHKDALRKNPKDNTPGWLLKTEDQLTFKEKEWRKKFEATYFGLDSLNELDFAHAELNYKGLTAWQNLAGKYPFITEQILNKDGVDVYFKNRTAFEDDLAMETEFCSRYFNTGQVKVAQNHEFDSLYSQKIVVPGISIRVKSLAIDLLNKLEENECVVFHWEVTVRDATQIEAEITVWTAGVTHEQPREYLEHNVQGIVGCWTTVPNHGYKKPFKIATPAPSAYINFTPDDKDLHISGGFGWTGEYVEVSSIKLLAKPVAEHFIEQINEYLGTNITVEDVDYCTRPSTPTGQPLLLTENSHAGKDIFITGSAKSGTTHAPVLSEYVLERIND